MKKLLIVCGIVLLSGCSTVQKYWPRPHDPVMFNYLVTADNELRKVDCVSPNWSKVMAQTELVALYATWRKDPQQENIVGLHNHVIKMSQGGSKVFCEIGKKTAEQRILAAKSAWEGR
jgi:hypothetical protein